MQKKYPEPQAFEEGDPLPITLQAVESNQVAAIGYDQGAKTLAVIFKRGAGALYQYLDVEQATFDSFMAAESKGAFFKEHIKPLPFKKYRPLQVVGVAEGEACA